MPDSQTPQQLRTTREPYEDRALLECDMPPGPIDALRKWIDEAFHHPEIREPNAMCVATVGPDMQPSARIVLLRGLDDRGLVFYTSYFSRKGHHIEANPRAAATFYWPPLHRQVRVEGTIAKISDDESDAYFASRPRGHQLSAWSSEQSEPVENRNMLEERMEHFEARFEGEDVPRPHSWGGYLITPERVEFWQGRQNRVHDRLEYFRDASAWRLRRLQP
jgi:pyridoxamine 5'-phosphate oxidase